MSSAGHNLASFDELRRAADAIRYRVLELTLERGGGYLSQACSCAETLAALYGRIMVLGPSAAPAEPPPFSGVPSRANPAPTDGELHNGAKAPHLDRFYLSPSHYCMALYAALIGSGRLRAQALFTFNRDGSTVEMIGAEHSPGMGLTTGSFGQALSQVAGIALARRLRGESGNTWLFMSDGEFGEGQVWEALAFAAMQKLDGIGVFVDVNGQQVDGPTREVFDLGDLGDKIRSFGAEVREVDGHDVEALVAAAGRIRQGRPLVVLAHTDPARGLPPLEPRKPDLHYVALKGEAERAALGAALRALGRSAGLEDRP